jgi:hypothetical protein
MEVRVALLLTVAQHLYRLVLEQVQFTVTVEELLKQGTTAFQQLDMGLEQEEPQRQVHQTELEQTERLVWLLFMNTLSKKTW